MASIAERRLQKVLCLRSTGFAPLAGSLSGHVLEVGIRFPMSYYTLITEVVEVFEHQKGSHLSDGVAR